MSNYQNPVIPKNSLFWKLFIITVLVFAYFLIIRVHYQNMYEMCLVEKINLNGKCIDHYRFKDRYFEFLFNNGLIGDS